MVRQKVLVIIGPTAVGKTNLSLQLARELSGEIISADSMQIYREMDIGTAKPSPKEREQIPHHLLDVANPDEAFNAADYVRLAEQTLQKIKARRSVALLVGGTGLYIDALLDGFLFPDTSADPTIRKELEERAKQDQHSLFVELEQIDPVSAKKIHPNDLRRIIRALEVYQRTGEAISSLQQKHKEADRPYHPIYIGLTSDRSELYERVNQRVDNMIAQGLVDEVEELLKKYPEQPTALQALGYKEIAYYLRDEMSLPDAIELLKRDTRRYAKRQLSWFRRNQRIHWFNRSERNDDEIMQLALSLWNSFH